MRAEGGGGGRYARTNRGATAPGRYRGTRRPLKPPPSRGALRLQVVLAIVPHVVRHTTHDENGAGGRRAGRRGRISLVLRARAGLQLSCAGKVAQPTLGPRYDSNTTTTVAAL